MRSEFQKGKNWLFSEHRRESPNLEVVETEGKNSVQLGKAFVRNTRLRCWLRRNNTVL